MEQEMLNNGINNGMSKITSLSDEISQAALALQSGMHMEIKRPQEESLELIEMKRALEANRRYQAILKEQMKRIEQAQQRNQELQKKIRVIITQSKGGRKALAGRKPGASFFVDADGNVTYLFRCASL